MYIEQSSAWVVDEVMRLMVHSNSTELLTAAKYSNTVDCIGRRNNHTFQR